jgi:ABC-type Fe3+-hydroxamate transport system substrate-binding protein
MKKVIFAFVIAASLTACGGNASTEVTTDSTAVSTDSTKTVTDSTSAVVDTTATK